MRRFALLVATAVMVSLGVTVVAQTPPKVVPLDSTGLITYYIAEGIPTCGSRPGDLELATWAFDEWQRSAEGAIRFEPFADEGTALIRLYWHASKPREYGQMRSNIGTFDRRTALIYVRPDSYLKHKTMGPAATRDPLLRDTIVYLSCLHEIGHALGLGHTTAERDIMRTEGSFANFAEYRRRLNTRSDIAKVPWLSDADQSRLRALYPRQP
jgi:hypothetical protein